jgi:hypothetical protein
LSPDALTVITNGAGIICGRRVAAVILASQGAASQTTTEYIFKAHVGKGGSVQTSPVNKQQLHDIERTEAKECKKGMADSPEDEAIRAQFEAQYGDGAVEVGKE